MCDLQWHHSDRHTTFKHNTSSFWINFDVEFCAKASVALPANRAAHNHCQD